MCRSDTETTNMITVQYQQSKTGEKNSKCSFLFIYFLFSNKCMHILLIIAVYVLN